MPRLPRRHWEASLCCTGRPFGRAGTAGLMLDPRPVAVILLSRANQYASGRGRCVRMHHCLQRLSVATWSRARPSTRCRREGPTVHGHVLTIGQQVSPVVVSWVDGGAALAIRERNSRAQSHQAGSAKARRPYECFDEDPRAPTRASTMAFLAGHQIHDSRPFCGNRQVLSESAQATRARTLT